MKFFLKLRFWWHRVLLKLGLAKRTVLPEVQTEIAPALAPFVAFVKTWREGFGVPDAPQPDRLTLMQEFGSAPNNVGVLRAIYDAGGLQRAVFLILEKHNLRAPETVLDARFHDRLYYADQLAANMTQISFAGCPDLGTQYIYGDSWKKGLNNA